MSLMTVGARRRRSSGRRSASGMSSDGIGELVREGEEEDDESFWCSDDDGADDIDSGVLRRRYRRARALVDSVLNKFHNGSARAVDPSVARALQQHESRLLSLQCFVEQGSIDRLREQKGDSAITTAAASAPPSGVSRLINVCGGYIGPGAVMRQWDQLSTGVADGAAAETLAMREYIELIDAMLPQWDESAVEHPVTAADCFWQDDASTTQCQYCGAVFSSLWSLDPCRRHHCRLCLAIFCGECSAQSIPLALCPGAPVRLQRVCRPCFQRAQRDTELAASRKLMTENRELERQLRELQDDARRHMDTKRQLEDKLRLEANACGCDLDAIDAAIASRLARMSGGVNNSRGSMDSPLASSSAIVVALALDTPPAHKFAPSRASVEATEQLALAHRQLQMALRAAQCRTRRALAQMDAILDELRAIVSTSSEANHGGSSGTDIWSAVLLRTRRDVPSVSAFLTLPELKALGRTCLRLRSAVARLKCEAKCVLANDVTLTTPAVERAAVWQAECLRDDKTCAYMMDLADEVRARLDSTASSASSSSLDECDLSDTAASSHRWLQLLSAQDSSMWHRAYALLLERCEFTALEFDAQIQCDVQRTFGASALRRTRPARKTYASASSMASQSSMSPPAVEARRKALANILRAFSCVNSEIGYCQGMDHVAALVLSVVDWDEARAFWLLTSLVASRHYELDLLFGPGLPRLTLRCFQLERLVAMHLPELARHLEELEFPISMVATGWFMTLFTNMEALPYDVVLRVLDGFLVAGWKQLFRVALVILDALQHHLIASGFDEIPQIFFDLQDYEPRLAITEEVIARAAEFKVTNSILKRLQHEYECLETPGRASSSDPVAALSRATSADVSGLPEGPQGPVQPSSSPRNASALAQTNTPPSKVFISSEKSLEPQVNDKQSTGGGGGKSKRARRRSRRRSSSSSVGKMDADGSVTSGVATRGASPLVDV